jgi:hypothetical protein
MPREDRIKAAVVQALLKAGWTITADPFTPEYEGTEVFADLAAERLLAAEKGTERILVEIKSFLGPSKIHGFETALGQYLLYRGVLSLVDPGRKTYLAVSEQGYQRVFGLKLVQTIAQQHRLAVLVVNLDQVEVTQWIN